MMKPAPAPPFVMAEPELLFQFLIIPFDDPALFGQRPDPSVWWLQATSITSTYSVRLPLWAIRRSATLARVVRPASNPGVPAGCALQRNASGVCIWRLVAT